MLRQAVAARKNILVAGGTSTGKTTLTNALLAEVAKTGDRVVLIEDTRELQCAAPNLVALRTKDGVVSLSDLVRSSLRLRPDRIPIGEVRGAEALDLLKAWGTGHPGGVGTIHAGSRARRTAPARATHPGSRRHGAPRADRRDHRPRRGAFRPRSARRLVELARVSGLGPAGDYVLSPQETAMIHRPFRIRRVIATAAAFITLATTDLSPAPAYAAGSNMPWEQPLNQILQSIEGPVAKIIAVIIIIVTGLTLAFGDTSGGFRRLIQIVFGLSIAFAAELLPLVLLLRRRSAGLMDGGGSRISRHPFIARSPSRSCSAARRARSRSSTARWRRRSVSACGCGSPASALGFSARPPRSGPPSAIRVRRRGAPASAHPRPSLRLRPRA